jgi:tetratricopeptide (TPR) repeat protein
MKRAKANDAYAMFDLGSWYYYGKFRLRQDREKAMALWKQAAALGSSKAHFSLGNFYYEGGDMKKAKFHYEAAAMAGHELAREKLGCLEYNSGNMERAIKHWTIAVSSGCFDSMNHLREEFEEGFVSRDEINVILTAYYNSCAMLRSEARDAYIQFEIDKVNYRKVEDDEDVSDENGNGEETDGVGGDDDGDAIENDGDNDLGDTGDDDDDNYGGNDDDSDSNDSHGSDSDGDSDNIEDLDVVYLEEEMRMILDDDLSFTTLEVGVGNNYYYFLPPDYYWGNLGRAIGNNRYLQEMSIYNWRANGQIITTENLVEFVSGFASNRSIQKLSIADWDFSDVGIQDNLIQFFTDNQTIESLTVREKRKRGDGWKVRISALGIILHSFNSLKEMSFSSDDEDRGIICVDDVLEGLIGHAGLSKIYLPRVRIERRGCTALASLLENLYSNHTSLTLSYSEFNAEGARILANGIRNNTTLTELNLDHLLYITKHGWMAIFDALQRSTCRLEKLSVESNYLSDDNIVARSLSLAILHHSSSLKTLGLGNNPGITGTGWNAIFQNLRGPNSMLETLSLKNPIAGYSITDEVLASLTNVLQNNSKLKQLDLDYSTAVTVR